MGNRGDSAELSVSSRFNTWVKDWSFVSCVQLRRVKTTHPIHHLLTPHTLTLLILTL